MGKLWEKAYSIDSLIESFTVGDDPVLDRRLVNADCVASMAHAEMLASIGILTPADRAALMSGLAAIIALNEEGRFRIDASEEDVHTAIENHLVRTVGEAGKRIHTARSRNDQVIAALRLWSRGFLHTFQRASIALVFRLLDFAERHAKVPMPGRTHTQLAMPSSVGLWAAAHAEELLDDIALARSAFSIVDCSPLGSAASYGVPLPVDREMVADLLGFGRVQNNVLYANNSRGKFESIILGAVDQTGATLGRMAQDLILFSLPELGYFTLPKELCTGSSIMPQKRNPDVLELIRAKGAAISADRLAVAMACRSLPSGYNRDFQETKGPFFRGCEAGLGCVFVMDLTVSRLVVNSERLRASCTAELFATDRALELVSEGVAFRDAYQQVGRELEKLSPQDPAVAIEKRTSTGTPGNLRLDVPRMIASGYREAVEKEEYAKRAKISALAGREVELFPDPYKRGATEPVG